MQHLIGLIYFHQYDLNIKIWNVRKFHQFLNLAILYHTLDILEILSITVETAFKGNL